jgi:glycosyltransferase involved in cell wall biosynthesis
MLDRLELSRAYPIIFDSKSKYLDRTNINIFLRFLRMVRIIGSFILLLIRNKISKLYLSLSGGWGQFYDLMIIALSILFKVQIHIHHHSFAYLNRKKLLTRLIIDISVNRATHIVLCARMRDLLKKYNNNVTAIIISNTAFIPNQKFSKQNYRKNSLTIGFLSNISFEKGINDYVDVFKKLTVKCNVNGLIAGPYSDKESKAYLEKSLNHIKEIKYIGSVSKENKTNFFQQIDVLLFPTNYVNEAEPLVIHEAMSFGIPVIARSRGCINQIIDSKSGLIVRNNDDYIKIAFETIDNWLQNPQELELIKKQAFERFHSHKIKNIENLESLVNSIST